MVLGTSDSATQALHHLHDAFRNYPRAWITDEHNLDVSIADLSRLSEEEQNDP